MRRGTHGMAAVAALTLVFAACGGDDDSSGEGGIDLGADDGGDDGGDDGIDLGADDGGDDDSASGAGSNDEAQESLDDAGVDMDLDELEESVSNFSTGEGSGLVTIDGVEYAFESEVCITQGSDFVIEGPGQTPDGTPFWGSISASEEIDFDGDGENDASLDVYVEVGKTEMFGSGADDQPNFSATKLESESMPMGEDISYEYDGERISGEGPIQDFNFVAAGPSETLPMTFEASCS